MKVNIRANNLKLTPAIHDYIDEKMAAVEKFLGNIQVINCDFEVELTTKHHHKGDIFRAEVNLEVAKDLLRVEKLEADLYKAIDKVKDHLIDVITKHKEKMISTRRSV
ncbi:MAG: ribosome-associated translation inhibitor RaiA [Candidatus Falkowbacteria bacterium]|nr:ribosome-associated translation inhibitor RaiA [Candidatus Falkowbacteria bacterium]